MRETSGVQAHWTFRRPWLAAAVLLLPMAAVYAAHLLLPPSGAWPTGFLQYDQQSYMAMARRAWEGGAWPLFALPTSADPAAPAQYFYPHIALLGLAQGLTGVDPGRLYVAFGLLAGLLCLRLAIALFGRVVPRRDGAAALGLLLFCWGGGLLVLSGLLDGALRGRIDFNAPFRFDPASGFWFLNLGRNLFYSVEAYYHAVVLGLLLALIDRRWGLALGLLALIAASHPFTGAQFLLVALAWQVLERLIPRERLLPRERLVPAGGGRPPLWLAGATAALLALFLVYHFLILPLDDEHAALMRAWSLAWTFGLGAQILAYGPVALLAGCWLARQPAERLGEPRSRLLLCVALVSLGLANHELVLEARQPLHFTRGYIWLPLFLLGAPLLVESLARWRRPLAVAVAALFLLDNAAWLTAQAVQNAGGHGAARSLAPEERAALAALNAPDYAGHLLVSEDLRLGYDALVYTPLRAWYSQEHSTPFSETRRTDVERWRATGAEPAAWRERAMVFLVADRGQDPTAYPWFSAGNRVQRLPGFLLIARPAP